MMSEKKIVAIHQPNFLPWLGFFDKIIMSDVFIFMDSVQFPKKGGSWGNRVMFNLNGKAEYVTLPINRKYHGYRTYREMEIRKDDEWVEKTLRTIRLNYSKMPFFEENYQLFLDLISYKTSSLVEFNLQALYKLIDVLEIKDTKYVFSSELNVEGNATDLLVSMVNAVDGTDYLCGGGAQGYQEDFKFEENGLGLMYQNFDHPEYPQKRGATFVKGCSIFDALFCVGRDQLKLLL